MAGLKDLFSLVDHKLAEVFHRVSYSPDKDRAAFMKRIDETKGKFLATEPARGKKDFAVENGVVEYRPSLRGGRTIKLQGTDANYIPSERFVEFLDGLRTAVAEGHLDKELEASEATGSTTVTSELKTRTRGAGATTSGTYKDGSGWSESRKAKFAETIAKRKAAKAAG